MCGRFARKSTQELLADWFDLEPDEMPWFAPTFNAAPQSFQPVVRLNRKLHRREAALLRWGLIPHWAKSGEMAAGAINARAEEAATKPAFREALKRQRCLIPADAFYEWQRLQGKSRRPFAFVLESGEPYAFAGLWDCWQPREGEILETFTILTTTPNQAVAPVHNRMPVILKPQDYERWLDPEAAPPADLLHPFPANEMRSWPVSERVGNVRNNDPALLEEEKPPSPAQGSLFK
jgi:putative SOS response-associated peptidase YedK